MNNEMIMNEDVRSMYDDVRSFYIYEHIQALTVH
jgi:hypothetical protein